MNILKFGEQFGPEEYARSVMNTIYKRTDNPRYFIIESWRRAGSSHVATVILIGEFLNSCYKYTPQVPHITKAQGRQYLILFHNKQAIDDAMHRITNYFSRCADDAPSSLLINKDAGTITHPESGSRIIALTANQYMERKYAKKFYQIIFEEPDMFRAEDQETLNNFVNKLRVDLDAKKSSRLIAIGTPDPIGMHQIDMRTMENMKKKLCVNQRIPAVYF